MSCDFDDKKIGDKFLYAVNGNSTCRDCQAQMYHGTIGVIYLGHVISEHETYAKLRRLRARRCPGCKQLVYIHYAPCGNELSHLFSRLTQVEINHD